MTLSAGTRLGPYEIVAPLGAGGMGEVYRARDTRLAREVAIKVLPAELSSHAERLSRFEQEARSASALSHPNIVTVYDVGRSDSTSYIAMELVEGKTLRDLLAPAPLPLRKAVAIAAQAADGLAKAHSAGIVHRDLKPENLMVSSDGFVKILDFGIAKLVDPETKDLSDVLTQAGAQTASGVVIGTVGYMSPEQASGRPLDFRTDQFSFGAILYEMLTGKRAFARGNVVDTLSAILHDEPDPVGSVNPKTPVPLRWVVERCLAKEAEERYASTRDLARDLALIRDHGAEASEPAAAAVPPPGTVSPSSASAVPWKARGSRLVGGIALAAAVAFAGAGATWWLMRARRTVAVPAPAITLTRLTSDPGLTTDPALSPDGRLLAYASDRSGDGNLDIYVRQVGGGEPLRLTRDSADDHEPAFSSNGTTIAFRSEREGGGIYVASALGGVGRLIAPQGRSPQFSPDGNWITYWVGVLGGASFNVRNSARIYVVAAAGGVPRQIQPDFVAAAYPVWSPDSRHLLFLGNRDNKHSTEESVDWWVTALEKGPAVKTGVLQATRAAKLSGSVQVYSWALVEPAWEPDGKSLVFSASHGDSTNLWRIGISPSTFKVTGAPERVTSSPTLEKWPSLASGPGGSVRVAFASLAASQSIWSLPIEVNRGKVTGELERLTEEAADDFHPALSPDGAKMVFVSTRSGHQEVWIRDMRTGEESALTASRFMKYAPDFSPDGSKVGFAEAGKWNTYIMSSAGGVPEMICEGCGQLTGWSSDGKRILCNALDGRVTLLNLDTRRKIALIARAGHWVCCALFSPDDRWVRFWDGTSGRLYAVPFEAEQPIPEGAWVDIMGNDFSPPDLIGNLAYFFSRRDGYLCIWAQRLDPATRRPVGTPFAIFHSHNARLSLANSAEPGYYPGRDRIVFTMGEHTGNIWMAEWKPQSTTAVRGERN